MYIAVYGTLKKGFGNHRFIEGNYIKTVKVPNYNLFTNSWAIVPFAVESNNSSDYIVAEIYDVSDNSFKRIRQLEIGAGYKEVIIPIDTIKATMWIYDFKKLKNWINDLVQIKSGEWTLDVEKQFDFDDIELEFDDEYDKDDLTKIDDEDDWTKIDDGYDEDDIYLSHLRDLLNDEDSKDPTVPKYPLDTTIPCECSGTGIKGSWIWDANLQAWRCEKCGEIQE